MMRKVILAIIGMFILFATAILGTSSAMANDSGSVWDRVAACESTNNWQANTGNGFHGGLQFTMSTWQAYGGSGAPEDASKSEQIAVAERVLAGQGPDAWPVCSAEAGLTQSNGHSSSPTTQSTTTDQNHPKANHQNNGHTDVTAPAQITHQDTTHHNCGTYTVHSGDTLSSIAHKYGLNWHKLYEHNKSVIGCNPDMIYPGEMLQIS